MQKKWSYSLIYSLLKGIVLWLTHRGFLCLSNVLYVLFAFQILYLVFEKVCNCALSLFCIIENSLVYCFYFRYEKCYFYYVAQWSAKFEDLHNKRSQIYMPAFAYTVTLLLNTLL